MFLVLQVIRQLVRGLVKLHVIRAGHDHHDHATVLAFLDFFSELRSFRPQLIHRRIDVIAHDRDRVLPRVFALERTRRGERLLSRPSAKIERKEYPALFCVIAGIAILLSLATN